MATTSTLSQKQDTLLNSLMASLQKLPRDRWREVQTFIDFLAHQNAGVPNGDTQLDDLEAYSLTELAQIAKSMTPMAQAQRLKELLAAQQARALTASEQQEAASLVEKEDLQTLRKAKALHLLKQRGALPEDIHSFLS